MDNLKFIKSVIGTGVEVCFVCHTKQSFYETVEFVEKEFCTVAMDANLFSDDEEIFIISIRPMAYELVVCAYNYSEYTPDTHTMMLDPAAFRMLRYV